MKKVLEINETIKKPIQIVEEALKEGLNAFADRGKLTNIQHTKNTHGYTAQFKNEVLCDHINQAYITTSLTYDTQTEEYTILNFRIKYQPNRMHILQHFWYTWIVRHLIRFQARQILRDFKYRLEKWF